MTSLLYGILLQARQYLLSAYLDMCVDEQTAFAWVWCYTPIIPAVGRLRQEDGELKASLDYIERTSLRSEGW